MTDTTENELLPEFAGFFEHARAGRLAFPRCRACTRFHWYPMPRCPHCLSPDVGWQPVSGDGRVYSFTRVTHAFDRSRADALPYVVAIVTFADAPGVRLVTNIVGDGLAGLSVGEAVRPVFAGDGEGGPPVCFTVARAGG
jgi:hypothetical protein